MKNIYLGLALVAIFSNAFSATQHQSKGFIWSGEGEKCKFTQNDEKSFYFSKNKENYHSALSTITFDNPNCMVKDSMGMGQDLNKMMINGRISNWYSHSDANFGTKVDELYDTSYNQGKGKCIQSKKYKAIAIAVDYIVDDSGNIGSVKHGATTTCFNNKKRSVKPKAEIPLNPSKVEIIKDKNESSDDLWKGAEIAKKIEFDNYVIKQKLIEIELNTINTKIDELKAENKAKVEKLVASLENSNKALLNAANKANDKRSMWNSGKENIEIYTKYLGSNKKAENALLFYNEMLILNNKMKDYGDEISLREAETILTRATLGKSAKDGGLAKTLLMYKLDRVDLIIVAKDYLNKKFPQ